MMTTFVLPVYVCVCVSARDFDFGKSPLRE